MGGDEEEGGRCRRSRCRALISSLMDFVSGVSVRNHAFVMGGHLLGEVLTAKHLNMSSKQPSDLLVMSQRLICTEEEEFLLEMLNLARKLHTLHHKARQKTYLLKCSHWLIKNLNYLLSCFIQTLICHHLDLLFYENRWYLGVSFLGMKLFNYTQVRSIMLNKCSP